MCWPKLLLISYLAFASTLQDTPQKAVAQEDSQLNKAAAAEPYSDEDAYQVYAALLQSEKHSFFVIQAEISSRPDMTTESLGIKGGREFMQAWGTVMNDFVRQNRIPKLMTRSLPLDASYELVPRSEIFKSQHGQYGWDDFYQRYPSASGFYWFSSVGFNRQRTRALVDMGNACGMLCGSGQPHFFEKHGTKWREVFPKATIPVWAS